ncbi:hypothetical protein J6590_032814 [Homalodisca vitripennis]|nr:hypothetical protein J6590_032814 [Homalodisca vitripennis]
MWGLQRAGRAEIDFLHVHPSSPRRAEETSPLEGSTGASPTVCPRPCRECYQSRDLRAESALQTCLSLLSALHSGAHPLNVPRSLLAAGISSGTLAVTRPVHS